MLGLLGGKGLVLNAHITPVCIALYSTKVKKSKIRAFLRVRLESKRM